MIRRGWRSLAIATFAAISALFLIQFTAAAVVELTIWDWHEPRVTLEKKYAEIYMKENPWVKIDVSVVAGNFTDKLSVALASGAPPEITQLHNGWAGRFTTTLETYPKDLFPRSELQRNYISFDMTGTINGEVYYLPLGIMNGAVYYNADILANAGYEEPPKDWPSFTSLAKQLTRVEGDGRINVGGFGILSDFQWLWTDIVYQFGGYLFGPEGGVTFTSEPSRRAFETLLSIVESNVDAPGLGFDAGTLAMKYNWTWYEAFAQRLPFSYGVAPVPTPTGASLPARGRQNAEVGLGVPTGHSTEKMQEAFRFIKWLYNNDEFIVELCMQLGVIPSRRAVWTNPDLQQNPAMRMLMQQAPYTIFPGPVDDWYWNLVGEASNRLKEGEGLAAVLDDVQRRGDALFIENPFPVVERLYRPPSQ
jgi:multiple sugar transport system substrate-binding protein